MLFDQWSTVEGKGSLKLSANAHLQWVGLNQPNLDLMSPAFFQFSSYIIYISGVTWS